MVDKPIPPDSDDQDSWEHLAKDLFGVEFDSPPVSPDDLDDELLTDDFLNDEEETEASDDAQQSEKEPAAPEEQPAAAEEGEPVAVTSSDSEEAEQAESVADRPPDADLDALLDFSQPYGEGEESDAGEEPETAQQASPEAEAESGLFEKLAAESEEAEDEEGVELAESDEDELESEDESDEQLDADEDDFWDVLEEFAPEELGTPHIDRGQPRGGKPPRDPEIGLVAGAPENELAESSSFETEFATDSDFGLGVLKDVETDEDDETEDAEAAESEPTGDTAEEPQKEKKPKRRRRRRRRGGRRKKPAAADTDENAAGADEEQTDNEELSEEEQEVEMEASRSAGGSRYKNIPTWSEAIDLIVDRSAKASSESRGRRGNRSGTKNRKRGGRRRRSRKS
jgi:hypothetical protein